MPEASGGHRAGPFQIRKPCHRGNLVVKNSNLDWSWTYLELDFVVKVEVVLWELIAANFKYPDLELVSG